MKIRFGFSVVVAFVAILGIVRNASAVIAYSTAGSTYSQSFDSLPNSPTNVSLGNSPIGWTDDNASPGASNFSIVGWYLYHPSAQTEGGFNGHQRVRAGSGSSGTGSFYSFGANGSTERALGDVGSTTVSNNPPGNNTMYFGLRINNGTGQTLDSFSLSYTGEQWRDGSNTVADQISVGYSLAATTTTVNWADQTATNPNFIPISGLTFTAPKNTATDTTLDGNAAANRSSLSASITGISWAAGTDLWIRFNEPQIAGNDDGMAIDDLSFSATATAVPEASSFLCVGLAAVVIHFGRRLFDRQAA